ncbi:uncharacterized protein LOC115625744 [Scaptodrosophila lebanonensis]|uniref:Uncharacterized protein LOC115625744 n=1 Tax=Drosophila lebanonensis TaxID=7225 RepID=A0A6J2TNR6_DROLE|nr:uncharacterized protein LOC115625744 [Scaptodrosophila lebanonensis]
MLQRLLRKLKKPGLVATPKQAKFKKNCKCEPTTCKCIKKRQQQQHRWLLSQLRRRGADNLSSVILF